MIYKIKYIIIVLSGCLVALFGCAGTERVSLEEALSVRNQEESLVDTSIEAVPAEGEALYIYVYICGAVKTPGVYKLEADSRIVAAIEAAGGFLEDAAMEAINLAERLKDGMQITVPTQKEAAEKQAAQAKAAQGLINLNTASAAELCTLNGIGEAKAEAILAYRTEIGAFSSIEQLKEVAGIGENLFCQIKSSIYIE